jgi:1-acyl-sn-glycerol-3-phosphate acyltransferase
MYILKGLTLLGLIFIYILGGAILRILTSSSERTISLWTNFINKIFIKILGIKISLEGNTTYIKEKSNFIVSNHVSYIDGLVLASIFAGIFVSKLSVRSWPVFGLMTWIGKTVYIDRQNKRKALFSLERMTKVLKNNANILIFPEGTSTDGTKILDFQSIFFEVPLITRSPIIPVTIQYLSIDQQKISLSNRDKVFWYGQVKFFKHLLGLLKLKNIGVKVIIHPKIETKLFLQIPGARKKLSQLSRQIILKSFSSVS